MLFSEECLMCHEYGCMLMSYMHNVYIKYTGNRHITRNTFSKCNKGHEDAYLPTFKSFKSRIALLIARKIASCDMAFIKYCHHCNNVDTMRKLSRHSVYVMAWLRCDYHSIKITVMLFHITQNIILHILRYHVTTCHTICHMV